MQQIQLEVESNDCNRVKLWWDEKNGQYVFLPSYNEPILSLSNKLKFVFGMYMSMREESGNWSDYVITVHHW